LLCHCKSRDEQQSTLGTHGQLARFAKLRSSRIAAILGHRRGTAVIEFALIAPLFLLTMAFICEIGLALFTQEDMDNGARYAARLIRIGTITGSSYSSTLISDICSNIFLVPSCSSNLRIYVAAAASGSPAGSGFSSISTATVSGGNITSSYASLAANDDVIVELGYSQPWAIGLVAKAVGGSNALLLSTVAVQTEPY